MTKVLGRLLLAGALLAWTTQPPTLSAAEADTPNGCVLACSVDGLTACQGQTPMWCSGWLAGCMSSCLVD